MKYHELSTNVSIVSVSRAACPPHFGQNVFSHLSAASKGFPGALKDTFSGSLTGKYVFNYQQTSNNRIIDCLGITESGLLAGRINEMDVFLNRYSRESWVTEEGHHPPVDTNWFDFNPKTPRVFTYDILGIAISEGIIELVDDGINPLPNVCLLYTSPSPRDRQKSRLPSSG